MQLNRALYRRVQNILGSATHKNREMTQVMDDAEHDTQLLEAHETTAQLVYVNPFTNQSEHRWNLEPGAETS